MVSPVAGSVDPFAGMGGADDTADLRARLLQVLVEESDDAPTGVECGAFVELGAR